MLSKNVFYNSPVFLWFWIGVVRHNSPFLLFLNWLLYTLNVCLLILILKMPEYQEFMYLLRTPDIINSKSSRSYIIKWKPIIYFDEYIKQRTFIKKLLWATRRTLKIDLDCIIIFRLLHHIISLPRLPDHFSKWWVKRIEIWA